MQIRRQLSAEKEKGGTMRRKFVLRCLSCLLAGMLLLDTSLQAFAENTSVPGGAQQSQEIMEDEQSQPDVPKEGEGTKDSEEEAIHSNGEKSSELPVQSEDQKEDTDSVGPENNTDVPVTQQPSEPSPDPVEDVMIPPSEKPADTQTTPQEPSDVPDASESEPSKTPDEPEQEEPEDETPKEDEKPADDEENTEAEDFFVLAGVPYGLAGEEIFKEKSEELLPEYQDVLKVLQGALGDKTVEADLSTWSVSPEVLQKLLSYLINDTDLDCSMLLPKVVYYYIEETGEKGNIQNVHKVHFSYLSEEDKLVLKQEKRTLDTGVKFSFVPDQAAEGYRLYRWNLDAEEWELAAEISEDAAGTCTDPIGDDAEYEYLLIAYRTEGGSEVICNFSEKTKSAYALGTPENLKVEGTDAAMTLTWDPVADATGYEVEACEETQEEFELLKTVEEHMFVHEGLEGGKTYHYRVRAVRQTAQSSVEYSPYSDSVTETTIVTAVAAPEKSAAEEPITIPAVELSVTPVAYNQIQLNLKDTAAGVSYEIYKKAPGASYQLVQTIPAGQGQSWLDESVKPGVEYTYQVRGVKKVQQKTYEGSYSKEVTGMTKLGTVSGLVAATLDMQSLNISWEQVPGADGYELYRSSVSGSGYTLLTTLPAQTRSYQDKGLTLGGTYYYQVRAYVTVDGKKVYGDYAPEARGTVKLSEVQNISVSQIKATALQISWSGASDAQSYEVYYSTSPDSGFKRLKTVKKTFVNFTKAKCGVTYYFKVRTVNKVGKTKVYSDDSAVISGRTVLTGSPVVTVKKVTYNSIALKWTKVKDAKKYEIWYSTTPDGSYQLLKTQGGTSFTHKKLITGQTYYYKVYPIRDSFKGDASNVVSGKSTLSDLGGLKVARSGNNQMKLSWKKVAGASNYVILRSTKADGNYAEIARTNKLNYTDTGLAANTTYYYKVYATSGVVDSKPAGPVSQSTPALAPAPTTPTKPPSDSSSGVSKEPLYYGVDVSSYQGKIDWEDVADDGIDFAMIRILTGKGTHDLSLDSRFEYNYRNARAAGVKVGVYRYSYATTRGGARREARRIIEVLDGRKLEYPIVLDMEDSSVLANTTREDRTEIILGFKDIVESAGYKFALYANKNWIDNYIDPAALKGVDIWFARWRSLSRGPGYTGPGNLAMWQYTDEGSVDGIPGRVDLDVSYKRY